MHYTPTNCSLKSVCITTISLSLSTPQECFMTEFTIFSFYIIIIRCINYFISLLCIYNECVRFLYLYIYINIYLYMYVCYSFYYKNNKKSQLTKTKHNTY